MSKFLSLCEQFDPASAGDPKWELIDFLKSKGINVSPVNNTDMLYIDTGSNTIPITVGSNEEQAESISADYGDYDVNSEVEGQANKAAKGMKGLAGRMVGTTPQRAKQALAKRQNVAKKAVDVYNKKTNKLEQDLRNAPI